MKKLFAALENEQTELPVSDEAAITEGEAIIADGEQIAASSDQIAEGNDISETLQRVSDSLPEHPASAETIAVLAPVMEHFAQRLGYQDKIVALEAFTDGNAKQQFGAFQAKLHESLSVANESMVGKTTSWFERTFRSDSTFISKIKDLATAIENGQIKETDIDPDWVGGYVLRIGTSGKVTSSSLVNSINGIAKDVNDVRKHVEKYSAECGKIAAIINEGYMLASKDSGRRILDAITQIERIDIDAENNIIDLNDKFREDHNFVLKPCDPADAKKLAEAVSRAHSMRELAALAGNLQRARRGITTMSEKHEEFRFLGIDAEDLRTLSASWNRLFTRLNAAIHSAAEVEHKLLYSVYRYMKASV